MKHHFSLILAFGVAISSTVCAQIPVTVTTQTSDSPMTMAEFAANTARWAQQVEQMTSQIDQMKQQYQSITGSRGLGTIMNNPALRDYLPQDWQQVYDSVQSGGYAGLSGRATQIYNDRKVYDACSQFITTQQRTSCQAQAVKPSQDKAFALDAYDAAKGRLRQIDQLMGQINETADPKAIAELQGRMSAEQAIIQNEQTKLQMYQMVAQAEDRLQRQQQREINAQLVDKRGHSRLQTFNPLGH
ncbi:putative type IV secretion system protein virB5 [Pseudomonas brassicacearum subsp. brassicacearum NFM421]|uniref:Putative type IV secretion system protein virB5 n=1 Tax=Pseudomonas brassicacearum (strain NFM421) TaxID=994484 RepID=F2KM66_PSEBN|nr:P-type DNA transfer protein VirB5 [Pseudomonas brassicacearum]AEA71609.1 putative type IV secretion system protein virB5 [Pseudomonas brassicacearum subsp. brassicacearum NFM421]